MSRVRSQGWRGRRTAAIGMLLSGLPGASAIAMPAVDDASPKAQVEIRREEQLYPVKGRDFAALSGQMRRLGPKREAGLGRTAALTRAEFVWEFVPLMEQERCAVDAVEVEARISIILPEWREAARAKPEMQAEWTRFLEALRSHERLHEAVAAESADEIGRVIAATPAESDCASLRRAVNQRARDALQVFRARNREIDALSAHGTAEGTRLVHPVSRDQR